MSTVFLSYSTKDHHFADLAELKLANANIKLWRDKSQLEAGNDWRAGIESAISGSLAILVALSPRSAESSYVTYEWAYALGKGKLVIPLRIEESWVHPRLKILQYFDFSHQLAQPWESLIERIRGAESEAKAVQPAVNSDRLNAVFAFLNQTKSSVLERVGNG